MGERAWDVVVVGAGNAAFCAALAAREAGASVVMLERAPREENGGNSRFTAGAIRFAYRGIDDLRAIMPDLTEDEIGRTDFGTYTTEQFFDDMFRVTRYRSDPELCELLVTRSFETMLWLRRKGLRFAPIWGRQAFQVEGRFKFWGGLTVEAWGGGPGLVDQETAIAEKDGIEIRYGARALALRFDGHAVTGVRVKQEGKLHDVEARSVILACGGFESNAEWRTRYLGPGWELAKVRGTRFNTGDGIRMALDIGASPAGNWSGCHAVGWDNNAPEFGDLSVGDAFQKHSYPFGVMVNATGKRFVDEGADFRNYTYAKYGRVILEQPDQFAWQVFDRKVLHLLRDEYRIKRVTKVSAETLAELAPKLEGVDAAAFLDEMRAYNAAVRPTCRSTRTSRTAAAPLAFPCRSRTGRTRSTAALRGLRGRLRHHVHLRRLAHRAGTGQVLDSDLSPIPGLYAAGELVGGLFYFNYPGGTGLMSGSVFGRIAGMGASRAIA